MAAVNSCGMRLSAGIVMPVLTSVRNIRICLCRYLKMLLRVLQSAGERLNDGVYEIMTW